MNQIRFWLIFGLRHNQETVEKKLGELFQSCEKYTDKGNNPAYLQASYKLIKARRAAERQGYKVNWIGK